MILGVAPRPGTARPLSRRRACQAHRRERVPRGTDGARSRRRALHPKCAGRRFHRSHVPPFDAGMTWSREGPSGCRARRSNLIGPRRPRHSQHTDPRGHTMPRSRAYSVALSFSASCGTAHLPVVRAQARRARSRSTRDTARSGGSACCETIASTGGNIRGRSGTTANPITPETGAITRGAATPTSRARYPHAATSATACRCRRATPAR